MKTFKHLLFNSLLIIAILRALGTPAVADPVTQLIWTTQPGSATNGLPFGIEPVLITADASGNPSTTGLAATQLVTVTVSSGTGPLVGTTTYNIGTAGSNGVVSFGNLQIDSTNTADQLTASAVPLYGAPVPGMAVWLDANTASSVLTNASGSVTNWLDLSGNGNNFSTVLGTGTAILYTNATTPSGRRTITFPGVGSLLNSTYLNTSNTISIFIVNKYAVSGVGGLNNVGPMSGTDGTNDDYLSVNNFDFNFQNNNPPTPVYERNHNLAYYGNFDPGVAYYDLEGLSNGTNNIIRINGGGAASNNTTLNNFVVKHMTIGGRLNGLAGQGYYFGDIAEALVYNNALDDADRQTVETYLSNKWFSTSFIVPPLSNAVSAPFSVVAQPIAPTTYEGFSYTAGASLDAENGGFGWSGNSWGEYGLGVRGFTVNSLGLEDPTGTLEASGNSVFGDGTIAPFGTNAYAGRFNDYPPGWATAGDTVYLSVLMRPDALPASSSFGMQVFNNLFFGVGQSGTNWDVESGSLVGESTKPATLGVTALLVLRIDFDNVLTTNSTFRLYVNPAPGASEPATADASIVYGTLGDQNGIALQANEGAQADFDEIRMGTSFAAVTPRAFPLLTITQSGGGYVTISWPTAAGATYSLNYSSSLTGPWTEVSASPTTVGGNYQYVLPTTGVAEFFQLVYQ